VRRRVHHFSDAFPSQPEEAAVAEIDGEDAKEGMKLLCAFLF
jgi:hypothetical protein